MIRKSVTNETKPINWAVITGGNRQRRWINLHDYPLDQPCPNCGCIPELVINKPLKEAFSAEYRKHQEENHLPLMCEFCVQLITDPPKGVNDNKKEKETEEQKDKTKFPRGWKLMKQFVDEEGNVYFKGKEQSELKGRFEMTVLKEGEAENTSVEKEKKPKLSKWEKGRMNNEALHNIQKLKKQLDVEKLTKKKEAEIMRQIKKEEKVIKKYGKYIFTG